MYEDLVKHLRNRANGTFEEKCEGCEFTEDFPPCAHCTIKAFNDAADAIEELDTLLDGVSADNDALCETIERLKKPRWIPVTEEPPLKVGDDGYNGYLVYANGYYKVADYTTDKYDNVPYFHVDGEYELDVTYFMPLLESPKEET